MEIAANEEALKSAQWPNFEFFSAVQILDHNKVKLADRKMRPALSRLRDFHLTEVCMPYFMEIAANEEALKSAQWPNFKFQVEFKF